MIFLKNFLLYGFLLSCLTFSLILYILGAARYVTDFEDNTCDMTYMFEYPQYVRIPLDDSIQEAYPRYKLYAYGEGFITEKLRRMKFSGIPVLFIPGNAGSHEQVRSLSSISLRKSLKHGVPFHFDYFTVSFNRDISALYGGVLMEETKFVSHCIKRILDIYKGNIDDVVLIGHSMGGIIAKGSLLMVPNMNASMASIIINLATPHIPSLVLDRTFANYYYNLESKLSEIKNAGTTVVSIGGGPRDTLITAVQTTDVTADINVLSTSIPDVWKSVDHLSILWCKQLQLSIVRALFDAVIYTKGIPRISSNPDHKMQALSYHFSHRAAGKKLHHYKEKIQFEPNGEWIEDIRKQYTWNSKINRIKNKYPVYLMIRLTHQFDHLSIDTINLETKDWLFICVASTIQNHSRICDWGWNLTNRTRMIPDQFHQLRKSVDLNLRDIKYHGMTHIIVRILPDDIDESVIVNINSYAYETKLVPVKSQVSFFRYLFNFRKSNLINITHGNTRSYIKLDNTQNVVSIELQNTQCNNEQIAYAVVELMELWNLGATQFCFFTHIDNGPKTMRIQTKYGHLNASAILRMTLNPECSYTFNVHSGSIIDQISCTVRDRWPILYMIIVSLLLLLIAIQIDNQREVMPTIVITMALALHFGILFETSVCIAVLCVLAVSIYSSIILFGSVAVRFLARITIIPTTWADLLLSRVNEAQLLTTIILLGFIPTSCGAVAMLFSVLICYLKLIKMYEDYLEELLFVLLHFNYTSFERTEMHDTPSTRQEILNHLILFLLWCFASLPAIPSILVWVKDLRYDARLSTEDPVLFRSWIVLIACSTMGVVRIYPAAHGNRSHALANVLRFISWVVLSMAAAQRPSFYQWCMPPVIAITAVLIQLNSDVPLNTFFFRQNQ